MARDACALVLAGGESKRFGSDKALAQFRGEPLLAHVLRGLSAAGFAQIALAAKEPQRYAAVAAELEYLSGRKIELLSDVRPFQTPLAGLAAGLSHRAGCPRTIPLATTATPSTRRTAGNGVSRT